MATNIANSIRLPEDMDVELIKRYSGLRGTVAVDDAADMVVHLASDAGCSYHGVYINIDKGVTAG